MLAVVLCAGMGTRLSRHTVEIPKALVPLNGRPILSYIWSALRETTVDEVVLVGGHGFDRLVEFAATLEGKPVRVLDNPDYRLGSILTLEKAFPHVSDGFIVANGDHIHPPEMIERLAATVTNIACACDRDRTLGDDDMKVELDASGRVARMDKKLSNFQCGYIGMTACPQSMFDLYRRYAAITRERYGDSANVERIIDCMALDGHRAEICDLSGIGWVEIDNESDLSFAQTVVPSNPYMSRL